FLVPLEHREIDHPEELELLGIEQLVPVVELLGGLQTKLTGRLVNRLLGTMSLRPPRPRGENQKIILAGAGTLSDLRHRLGIVAIEPLGIVVYAQPAILSEGFQLVALLAAGRARSRKANRQERHSVARQFREQVLDGMHRWNAAVRLVAAIVAH